MTAAAVSARASLANRARAALRALADDARPGDSSDDVATLGALRQLRRLGAL